MKTQCPNCHTVREVPDGWAGKTAKCPDCHTSFKIISYSPRQKLTVERVVALTKELFTPPKTPQRTLLISVWEAFGWIWFIVPMVASVYVIIAHRDMAIPYLLAFAPLAFLPSMVAFTVAEIIRTLRANIRVTETLLDRLSK